METNEDKKEYETDIVVRGLRCLRCGHTWIPRKAGERPLTCPDCHSAYAFKPRVRPKKENIQEVKDSSEAKDSSDVDNQANGN